MKEYIAIFTISALLYANSLFCGFVFDDLSAIVNNRDVDIESPWSNLLWNDFWGTPMSEVSLVSKHATGASVSSIQPVYQILILTKIPFVSFYLAIFHAGRVCEVCNSITQSHAPI